MRCGCEGVLCKSSGNMRTMPPPPRIARLARGDCPDFRSTKMGLSPSGNLDGWKPCCCNTGMRAATSGGELSVALLRRARNDWLLCISANSSRMYWVPISEGRSASGHGSRVGDTDRPRTTWPARREPPRADPIVRQVPPHFLHEPLLRPAGKEASSAIACPPFSRTWPRAASVPTPARRVRPGRQARFSARPPSRRSPWRQRCRRFRSWLP